MIKQVEAEVQKIFGDITGEARRDLEQALGDAKQEEVKIAALVGNIKQEIEAAVTAAAPEVKAAVEASLTKLVDELEKLIAAEV